MQLENEFFTEVPVAGKDHQTKISQHEVELYVAIFALKGVQVQKNHNSAN